MFRRLRLTWFGVNSSQNSMSRIHLWYVVFQMKSCFKYQLRRGKSTSLPRHNMPIKRIKLIWAKFRWMAEKETKFFRFCRLFLTLLFVFISCTWKWNGLNLMTTCMPFPCFRQSQELCQKRFVYSCNKCCLCVLLSDCYVYVIYIDFFWTYFFGTIDSAVLNF